MDQVITVFGWVGAVLHFCADLFAVALGIITLFGLIKHRNKIPLFVSLINNVFVNERLKRIRDTLSKLDHVDVADKPMRKEIWNLLGELCGQIRPLAEKDQRLRPIYIEIEELLKTQTGLTEPKKRQITSELNSRLEAISFEHISIPTD